MRKEHRTNGSGATTGVRRVMLRSPYDAEKNKEAREDHKGCIQRYKRFGAEYDAERKQWSLNPESPSAAQSILALRKDINDEAMDNEGSEPYSAAYAGGRPAREGTSRLSEWMDYYRRLLRLTDFDDAVDNSYNNLNTFASGASLEGVEQGLLQHRKPNKGVATSDWLQFRRDCGDYGDSNDEDVALPVLLLIGRRIDHGGKEKVKGDVIFAVSANWNFKEGTLSAPDPAPTLIIPVTHQCTATRESTRDPGFYTEKPVDEPPDQLTWRGYWAYLHRCLSEWSPEGVDPNKITDKEKFKYHAVTSAGKHLKTLSLELLGFMPGSGYTPPANKRLVKMVENGIDDELFLSNNAPLLNRAVTGLDGGHEEAYAWKDRHLGDTSAHHLGHLGDYPLDLTQRKAIWQALACDGPITAISGPPGTGKTSLLQSFVASLVVRGALANEPVVVLASSQTNQATTNIIRAFQRSPHPRAPVVARRWVAHMPHYGWYAAAPSRREDSKEHALLVRPTSAHPAFAAEGVATDLKSPTNLSDEDHAIQEQFFIDNAHRWYAFGIDASDSAPNVADITARLHADLESIVDTLSSCIRMREECERSFERIPPSARSLWDKRGWRLREQREFPIRSHPRVHAERMTKLQASIRAYERHLAALDDTPLPPRHPFLRWFWMLGKTAKRHHAIMRAARRYLTRETSGAIALSADEPRDRVRDCLIQRLRYHHERWKQEKVRNDYLERRAARREARRTRAAELHADLRARLKPILEWDQRVRQWGNKLEHAHTLTLKYHDESSGRAIGEALSQLLKSTTRETYDVLKTREASEVFFDLSLRRAAFCLAMRYWEGRWLNEVEGERTPLHRAQFEKAVRLAAMLAPVVVTTAQSAPQLVQCNPTERDGYLWSIADWLVLDEAGQIPPTLAMPLFALSQRAFVIGDEKQLPPVQPLPMAINQHCRDAAGIGGQSNIHATQVLDACQGNAMRIASWAASRHEKVDATEPWASEFGVQLRYHYRCRPSIIEFCNWLTYSRRPLIPKTTELGRWESGWKDPTALPPEEAAPLPPMSFVWVDAESESNRGSPEEVHAVRRWLEFYLPRLRQVYEEPIEQHIAVITPYREQTELLRTALGPSGMGLEITHSVSDPKLLINTVHALQGAERPIILFSGASSDPKKFVLMNAQPALLNVAVSRAQDAFVFFANRRIVSIQGNRPAQVLGQYMRKHGYRPFGRDLLIGESQTKMTKLAGFLGAPVTSVATNGRFRKLAETSPLTDVKSLKWEDEDKNEGVPKRIRGAVNTLVQEGDAHFDAIYLATDDDLEGELIAWHVLQTIDPRLWGQCQRLRFYAVAEDEIRRAVKHATHGVDSDRVRAALTKSVVDQALRYGEANHRLGGLRGLGRQQIDALYALYKHREENPALPTLRLRDPDTGEIVRFRRLSAGPLSRPATKPASIPTDTSSVASESISEVQLRWRHPAMPALSTSTVMGAALRETGLSPEDVESAMEELYLGRSIDDQTKSSTRPLRGSPSE